MGRYPGAEVRNTRCSGRERSVLVGVAVLTGHFRYLLGMRQPTYVGGLDYWSDDYGSLFVLSCFVIYE